MLRNNNGQAVKRISVRSMKQNRIRNLFVMLAVILMTFMFTTVFSIGFSMAKNMSTMMLRQQGTRSQIFLMYPTKEQVEQARTCEALQAAGVMIPVAAAEPVSGEEFQVLMKYHETEDFQYNIMPAMTHVKGEYPVKEHEIMMSVNGLSALGIKNPKTGIKLSVMVEGVETDFVLTGYFKSYGFRTNIYEAYVSKAYADSFGLTPEKDGMLSMSAKRFSERRLLKQLEENVDLSEDQKFDISFSERNDPAIFLTVLFVCLMIVISGYLLIYNIMYISVSHDIRFYGMLKTIGTTPKQIQKIVTMQAFRLMGMGIPIGIGLGTVISLVVVPFAMDVISDANAYTMMPHDISFHPLVYVGTILFAVLTVLLSCRKPAKIAGRVSPVEALRYNGVNGSKIRAKRTTTGGRLYKMAYRNVFREKKRAALVFASMLMGVLVLFVIQTFFSCLKLENYADYSVPDDYTIFPIFYSDNDYEKTDPKKVRACEKLIEDIKNIDGIYEVMLGRYADVNLLFDKELYRPFLERAMKYQEDESVSLDDVIEDYESDKENKYCTQVIGIDRKVIERHNKKAKQKLDIDAFERGELCLIGFTDTEEQAEQFKGKTLTLIDPDTKKKRDITVGACMDWEDDAGLNIASSSFSVFGAPHRIFVSQAVIDKLTSQPSIQVIMANCVPEAEAGVTKEMKELMNNNSCIPSLAHVEIKSEILEDLQSSMISMNTLVTGISIVLIIIGTVNFVNVMLTGIFTRRKELAIMESVGMTKKQVKRMLMMEGVYYGLIITGLIFTVGSAVVYRVATWTESMADYAVFSFPWQLMLFVSAMVLFITILVPAVLYHMLSKESVTERIRMGQ